MLSYERLHTSHDLRVPRTSEKLINTRVRILRVLYEDPMASYSKLQRLLGADESTIKRALAALRNEGFLTSHRKGRGSEHRIDLNSPLAPDIEITVGDFLRFLGPDPKQR